MLPDHAVEKGPRRQNRDRLHDLAISIEPEDGIIWVYGTEQVEVLASTPFGVETLVEMLAIERDRQT